MITTQAGVTKKSQTSQICFDFPCEKCSRYWTSSNLLGSKTPISGSHFWVSDSSLFKHRISGFSSETVTLVSSFLLILVLQTNSSLFSVRFLSCENRFHRHAYSQSLDHSPNLWLPFALLWDSGERRWMQGTARGSHSSSRYRSGRWRGLLPDE